MSLTVEERLAMLENRVALLEGSKVSSNVGSKEMLPIERVLCNIGVSLMMRHTCETIIREPHSNQFDNYLGNMLNCKITKENRVECAHTLLLKSFAILTNAVTEFEKTNGTIRKK